MELNPPAPQSYPCARCGVPPTIGRAMAPGGNSTKYVMVHCDNCGACVTSDNEYSAITRWNRNEIVAAKRLEDKHDQPEFDFDSAGNVHGTVRFRDAGRIAFVTSKISGITRVYELSTPYSLATAKEKQKA